VFGTLLDPGAGAFRLAPFGINVPLARMYEPGTNVLHTTWHTPPRASSSQNGWRSWNERL
jgi:alpha,alpha-trehalase